MKITMVTLQTYANKQGITMQEARETLKNVAVIAEELGVTPQTVRAKMKQFHIQPTVYDGRGFLLDARAEKTFKRAFKQSRYSDGYLRTKSKTEKTLDVLLKQSEMLKEQMEVIRGLVTRLEESHEIIKQGVKLKPPSKLARADSADGGIGCSAP